MPSPSSSGATLSPSALQRMFNHLDQIGSQVNQMVVKFSWDRILMLHLKIVTSQLSEIRLLLRTS